MNNAMRDCGPTPYETAIQLGSHPNASRRIARVVTYDDLVDIWRAAKSIHDVRLRRRAEEQILGISKKKFWEQVE